MSTTTLLTSGQRLKIIYSSWASYWVKKNILQQTCFSIKQIRVIILMQTVAAKGINLNHLRHYNTQRIVSSQFRPIPINVKLASNPFLKDQQKYHYLVFKLNEYNKRIGQGDVKDPYEAKYYERLLSVLCDIGFMDTKANQVESLEKAYDWAKEQEQFVLQRKDQGEVRYQVTKEVKNGALPEKKQPCLSQRSTTEDLPSDIVARAMLPFKKGWRTIHKELDIPARRLSQYKKKIYNLTEFIQPKQEKIAPKVTYPKMPRIQYKQEEPEEAQAPVQGAQQAPQEGVEGQLKDKQAEEEKAAEQQQQDLGGFGEEPQQPEEEEPPGDENDDKLAPKLKSYAYQYQDVDRKEYKGPYMFYKGEDYEVERRMEQKYLKMQHEQIKKQKQDRESIAFVDEWAAKRSKMDKQHQKRLQNAMFNAKYSFSLEEPPKRETLSAVDELRFGFTQNLRKPKINQIQLSSTTFPRINQEGKSFEKSIRRDRINSLKNKFAKLLNIQEYEDREVSASLCQYTSRKRGISEIIKNHSKSKERLHQLDEVTRIKQKLSRNKVQIDIRSLSMGLCVPEQESQNPDSFVPPKALPSNPDLIETKKKKKKK